MIRPLFNLESSNLARTSMPADSTDLLDMTSPATSGRHLWKFRKRSKVPPPTALGWISGEQFKRGSRNFTHFSGTASLTNLPDMTSVAASGRLCKMQLCIAQRWVKLVRPALRRMIQSRFEARSPVMTRWILLNVCQDCKIEWRWALPNSTNWWASCLRCVPTLRLFLCSY